MYKSTEEKSFLVLLIIIFILFGITIGAAIVAIWMAGILDKFPTLVVGVLAAIFAFLGVVLSQVWQSKNTDKMVKVQIDNLLKQLNSQQVSTDKTIRAQTNNLLKQLGSQQASTDKIIKAQADNLLKQLDSQQISTDKTIKAQADNLLKQLDSQQISTDKTIKAQTDNLLKQLDSQQNSQLKQLDHEREAINIKLDHEKEVQKNKTLQEKKEEFCMSLFWCRHYALEQSISEYNYTLNSLYLRTKKNPSGKDFDAERLKEISIKQSQNLEKYETSIPKYRENYFKVLTLQMQYNFVSPVDFETFKEQQKILFDSLINLDKTQLENGDFYLKNYFEIRDAYNKESVKYFNDWSKTIDQIFNNFKLL